MFIAINILSSCFHFSWVVHVVYEGHNYHSKQYMLHRAGFRRETRGVDVVKRSGFPFFYFSRFFF